MEPTAPPPNDQLLDRLAALGPVLDDLTREVEDRRDRGERHGRQPGRDRAMLAVAAVILVVAALAGLVALFADDGGDTMVASPTKATTTTEPETALSARVAERLRNAERCGPLPSREQVPVPWPEGWEMVQSSDCDTAYVQDPGTSTDPVPVYVEPKVTEPVAYWSEQTGWIDAAEYGSPSFDLARYRRAYQAALQEQPTDGGG
jgi:hypothetical protein